MLDRMGAKPEDVFKVIGKVLTPLAKNALVDSKRKGMSPRAVAVRKVKARIDQARKKNQKYTMKELTKLMKSRWDF